MLKFRAGLACATGIILAVAVTAINLGGETIYGIGLSPAWGIFVFGYLPAALLLAGGLLTLRGAPRGPLLLMMAWGFIAGIGWTVGFLQLWELADNRMDVPLGLSGMLMAIAAMGLTSAQSGMRREK